MELVKIIQKQMIDLGVDGNKELEELSGVGYGVILRLMKGSDSIKLKDLKAITGALKIKLNYVTGEE